MWQFGGLLTADSVCQYIGLPCLIGLPVHVCLACLDCLRMMPLQTEEVLSPRYPRRHHAAGKVLRRCGAGVWVYSVRGHWYTQA